jgi:hypothetical protein
MTWAIIVYRFQLYYYANAEHKKEERKDTILTIDTRNKTANGPTVQASNQDDGDLDSEDTLEPALQLAIKTK